MCSWRLARLDIPVPWLTMLRSQADPRSPRRHPRDPDSGHLPFDGSRRPALAVRSLPGMPQFYDHEDRRRVALPTISFERQRYWLDPLRQERRPGRVEKIPVRDDKSVEDGFDAPTWERLCVPPVPPGTRPRAVWLAPVHLRTRPTWANAGDAMRNEGESSPSRPTRVSPAVAIWRTRSPAAPPRLRRLDHGPPRHTGRVPSTIVHLWNVTPAPARPPFDGPREVQRRHRLLEFAVPRPGVGQIGTGRRRAH